MRQAIEIISVNIGEPETIRHGARSMTTGICKRPAAGPVPVGELGLQGDQVVDTKHHGGTDQAVYAYRLEDYEWWSSEVGLDFEPGLFGENLTISGLPGDMVIGDRLLVGDVVLEATSARIPCGTLAMRVQDSGFGMAFRKAERPGIYFRVLNPGTLAAGDPVEMVECGSTSVTVLDLFRFAYETSHDADGLRRMLDAPIAERIRAKVEAALEVTQQD